MEVMFGGFEDGGWWLVVLGCRGEFEVAENWPKNIGNSWGVAMVRERRREKMRFGFGCIFID